MRYTTLHFIICVAVNSLFLILLCACDKSSPEPPAENAYFHENILFPLQSEHVHGPTIVELPNGDLLSAWFQGAGERWADDVRIMGARLMKGDSVWSSPFLMADKPGFPDINPMLFLDQGKRLWLMWYPVVANQWESSIPMYRISEDYERPGTPEWIWQDVIIAKPGDKTERGIQPGDRFVAGVAQQLTAYEAYLKDTLFPQLPVEEQKRLTHLWKGYKQKMDSLARGKDMIRNGRLFQEGQERPAQLGYPLSRRIGWQTKNKPFLLEDRIIVPLYSDGLDCAIFALTDDLGKTWQFSNPVIGGIGIQATIAIAKNGDLHAYLRDNGPPPQRMQHTISTDRGMTWSIARDAELPNPGAGFDMTTLRNGDWAIVYNHTEKGRHDLSIAISDDEGKTWKWRKQLEFDDRGALATRSHYPAIIQGADGRLHVVYSFHHNDRGNEAHKTIKYASFGVDWVKN